MILEKIVLENFKSYAGRQVIGPFHQNFTSIVGPNGSGKSNLIESLLFVFGYNASWMRLNKLKQLIHNSLKATQIKKAIVEMHFKKHNQQLYLRRIVNNFGVSKYQINGKQSTQNQVRNRLRNEGIDLFNNRFLILQGQVQQISQMKPKSTDKKQLGLLQYLQDVIGSNIFITQIQQNTNKFLNLQQKKHEKGQLMKAVQCEVQSLQINKNEGIKYIKNQKYLYQLENIYYQVFIQQQQKKIKILVTQHNKLQKQKQQVVIQQKQKLKKQSQRIKQIKNNRIQIQNKEKDMQKQQQYLQKLNYADKNIIQELKFKTQDLVKYQQKIESIQKQIIHIINQTKQLQQKLPTSTQNINQLKNKTQTLRQQLQKYDKPQVKIKIKQLERQIKHNQYQLHCQQSSKIIKQKQYQKFCISNNIQNTANQIQKENEQKLTKILEVQTIANKSLNMFNKQCENYIQEKQQIQSQLNKINIDMQQLQNQVRDIGSKESTFQLITKQNIPDVIGRLGDLAIISKQYKKYDQVITTCLGGKLNNIVVRNYQAANAVIQYVKIAKLGRTSCIILQKIKEYRNYMRKSWRNLPNSMRLFDVIKPINQEVKVAFYFVLGDTLYCEDSNLGLKYAIQNQSQRHRVISKTYNQYIIYEINGLMHGCSKRKGGLSQNKSKNITSFYKQIQTLKQKKMREKQKLKQIQTKILSVNKQIKQIQEDLQNIKKQKNNLKTMIKIRQQQQNFKIESHTLNKQKLNLQQQLNKLQLQINKLTQKNMMLRQYLQQAQHEQKQAQSNQVNSKRIQFKKIKQQFIKFQSQHNHIIAVLQKTPKTIQQYNNSKKNFINKVKLLQKQINSLQKQQQNIQKKATQVYGRITSYQQTIRQLKKYDKQLCIILQQDDREVRESKKKIQQAKQKVNQCKQLLQKSQYTLQQYVNKLYKVQQKYTEFKKLINIDINNLVQFQEMSISIEYKSQDDYDNKQKYDNYDNSTNKKIFPIKQLRETQPNQGLQKQLLDKFVLFIQHIQFMIVKAKKKMQELASFSSSIIILKDYYEKYNNYIIKTKQLKNINQQLNSLKQIITNLKDKRLSKFRQGFNIINYKLKQVYQLLTKGGDAQLQMIDTFDPFSDGIGFSVRPQKKTWKQVNKLSGGQKTLSSLSLIFALHHYKPTPLYFMDEIDAALDYKNVAIVAEYIKKRTKNAQFVVVSLRSSMFEQANKLIGVYKVRDQTKVINWVPNYKN